MEMRDLLTHWVQHFEAVTFAPGEDGSSLLRGTKDHFTLGVTPLHLVFHEKKQDGNNGSSSHDQELPRKRARLSCNACKARKTKASFRRTQNGTCHHCGAAGIPCETDLRSRKRPFYRVSGDVYEHSIKLLRRFVPEAELPELTVDNIQGLLRKLESAPAVSVSASASEAVSVATGVPVAVPDGFGPALDNVDPALLPGADPDPDPASVRATAATTTTTEVMGPDEHPLLQEKLGCLLLDSMGKYRYVGADSSIRWNHAARMVRESSSARAGHDVKIIPPLKTGLLPPTTPDDGSSTTMPGGAHAQEQQPNLVHCLYWFFSAEQFYSRLDGVLDDAGTAASASWLRALYSVFAMG
ncbi:hypothetical protein B0T24DRAFT_717964 [Lasiosphaeria ovina]|uniref:Zn(2)-C6 fungal-type domain-containing protein n=1 Tax=Lasiosphaeria ovina TaxID=92902 RepID=A0AAE0TUS6_9PEZI|nr:hypothetical protein B0T24DRAFT_717964 [Lasiosphaeria ovina]